MYTTTQTLMIAGGQGAMAALEIHRQIVDDISECKEVVNKLVEKNKASSSHPKVR